MTPALLAAYAAATGRAHVASRPDAAGGALHFFVPDAAGDGPLSDAAVIEAVERAGDEREDGGAGEDAARVAA